MALDGTEQVVITPVQSGTGLPSPITSVTTTQDIADLAASFTDITLGNGDAIRTDTTTGHTGLIQVYDVDGAAYSTFVTLTNGNTPAFALAAPVGGSLTVDSAVIGGTTAAAATVTALTVNTSVTLADTVNIAANATTGTKIGTATTQKFGFYNAAPVAQQAATGTATGFTAGSGTAVNDDSTFTGGSGTKAYNISDIVLALKNLGLLAAS